MASKVRRLACLQMIPIALHSWRNAVKAAFRSASAHLSKMTILISLKVRLPGEEEAERGNRSTGLTLLDFI